MKLNKQRSLTELATLQGYVEFKINKPGVHKRLAYIFDELSVEIFRKMQDGQKWNAECDSSFDAGAAIAMQSRGV
jgi:hypothetical protein